MRPVLALALCLACGNSGASGADARVDADPNQPDADIPNCTEDSLEIGRCEVMPDGEACTGPLDDAVFVSVPEDGDVRVVLGPQGANMMVFSLRTSGLDPGDLDNPASRDRPDVSLFLFRDEQESMGFYTGRPSFTDNGNAMENQDALGVFLIIERPVARGELFRVVAEVEDQNGEYRCGNLRFKAAM